MKRPWWIWIFYVAATSAGELDYQGPSLMDDLLLPYEFDHGSSHHIRHIREIQNPKYNFTFETFPANVTERLLPITNTRYFVSDVPVGYYRYTTVKAYGHLTTVTNPLRTFSVLEPRSIGGCGKNTTETVENSAKQRKCLVAQNGGFFNTKTGSCLGNLVSDGRLVQDRTIKQNANFGITKNGTIVVGYLSSEDIETLDFKQLIGGAIWLVRNGSSYVEEAFKCESSDVEETGTLRDFIDVQSARTAIGHDSLGRIILVNVEGQTRSRGVDLKQFANLLIDEFHLVNAINLDGGGSATLVLNGSLSSYPSDHCKSDPEWRCARAITTIVCVHDVECVPECVHGECVHGRCSCVNNFKGDTCDHLYCGYHNCSSHGVCTPDGCNCYPGWHGRDCTVPCKPGYYGKNCSQECRCQNNGTCDSVDGTCLCLPGFGGSLCEKGCELGTYGRNCAYKCHCTDSCYCDAISGVCDNTTTTEELEDNPAIHVAKCLMKREDKEKEEQRQTEDFVQYHWIAIFCTTVGALVISIAFNIYLLLVKTDCTSTLHGDYRNLDDDYDANNFTARYVPLQMPQKLQDSHKMDKQVRGIHYKQTSESDAAIQKSTVGIHRSPERKTRPFSMESHRKFRTKRKSKLPSLKRLVENFASNHKNKDGYQKLAIQDSAIEYEETSLLSEIR